MNRILVPIDGSPKSLIALEHIKTTFSPKAFEIVLMMVHENMMMITDRKPSNRFKMGWIPSWKSSQRIWSDIPSFEKPPSENRGSESWSVLRKSAPA